MKTSRVIFLLRKAFLTTPLYGRTIAVLGFLCLVIKQIGLIITSSELLKESTIGGTMANYGSFFISDFLVFFVLVLLVTANKFLKKKLWRLINNLILLIIFLLFVIDIFSLLIWQSKVSIFDLPELLNLSVVKFSRTAIGGIVVVPVIILLVFLLVQSTIFKKNQRFLLSICCFFFAFVCLATSFFSRPGSNFPDNVLSSNISAVGGFIRDEFGNVVGSTGAYASYFTTVEGQGKKPNVILIFAESLSAIDSLRDGGVNNNLPYFDKIQAQGITFTNFIANGCTSDTAHIALLEGVEPRKFAWQQDSTYSGYTAYTESLPKFFAEQGYTPIFLSTASLDFLQQRAFISNIGFTTIIGDEAFTEEKKYVFEAAPDQALYDKTLQTIKQQKKPYFVALQTISFHKPYNSPYGNNEQNALRYADKSLYYFYQQLKKNGFFDNGLLIIVGDHRKMEGLTPNEKAAMGTLRYARPVATILGVGIKTGIINTNIIQHTDFFYSLKQLVGNGKVTVSKLFNDTFSTEQRRFRGLTFCRLYANVYGVASNFNSGTAYAHVSDLQKDNLSIYRYIQAYAAFQQPRGVQTGSQKNSGRMIIIAHQGSPLEAAENSLSGFLLAAKYGADGVEFDVSQTKDKVNVVVHGEPLFATVCGRKYKVSDLTYAELQAKCPLRNGEKIVSLEEMLKKIKGLFDYYFVEIKVYNQKDAEKQTIDAIQTVQKLGMEDKIIFTSYDKTVTYLLGSYKNIHAGRDTYDLKELNILPHFAHEYYLMAKNLITDSTAQEVADMGKKLVVYVANTRDEIEKLYHEGVRIIMTDDVIATKDAAERIAMEEK